MKNPRINYIEQINVFWKQTLTEEFKIREIGLYTYLLHVNNSCHWKKSFSHNNKHIEATLGITYNTLKVARNRLKEAGLIDFQTKNGSPNTEYQILTLSKFHEVSNKVHIEVSDEISKTKEKQNNIKRDNDVFSDYLRDIVDDKNADWRKTIYDKHKLANGSLNKLAIEFVLSLKSYSKPPAKTYDDFIAHFVNWLNTQERLNKLGSHKKNYLIGGI